MNLFGEPELGIDYILHRRLCRLYVQTCTYCNNIIYRPKTAGREVFFCNKSCQATYFSTNRQDSGNPNWKGERKTHYAILYSSIEYKVWRNVIFERDDYTCQECDQRGGDLEAHHIHPVSMFPEKIFDIENGITLCNECHKKIRGRELEFVEKYLLLT